MDIAVPEIGHFIDVPVIEVHVTAGDVVAAADPVITLESDKATLGVPAPAAGTVSEVAVRIGDRVPAKRAAPQRQVPRPNLSHLGRVTLAALPPSIARVRPSLLTAWPSGPAR